MAIETALHSNAFNADDFVQNGVDPRTGQYTVGINFLPVVGNDQVGPGLPLKLVFNPFSKQDNGFGIGWYLEMTQYLPGSRMLRLHTGESYRVTGSGAEPSIRERKLDTFKFYDDSIEAKPQYRVVHKSYLEEVLHVYGTGNSAVALPSEVRAASGHRIKLYYTPGSSRLESIVDGNGLNLLKISYAPNDTGTVTIDLHPGHNGDNQPLTRYTLTVSGKQLRQLDMPREIGGNWRFVYGKVRELDCLTQVSTPYGAVDEVKYEDGGHLLPGGGTFAAIPRVTTHLRNPGGGQAKEKTTYKYTITHEGGEVERNFVGNGSGISWRDDGEDNLYRASSSYMYSSTAMQWREVAGSEDLLLRTTQRWYNRFHLQVREVTRKAGKAQTIETVYHGNTNDDFEKQPGNFQLPLETFQSWADDAQPGRTRPPERHRTAYDLHGNLVEETSPSGKRTVIVYYPAQGGNGCPADPDGFVRNVEHVTEYPAASGDAKAPVRRKRYGYEALERVRYADGLATASATTWLMQHHEIVCEVVNDVEQAALQVTSTEAVNNPQDLLRHGRPQKRTLSMGGKDTTTSFTYSKESRAGHPVLITEQCLTGFDHGLIDQDTGKPRHSQKRIVLETSMLIGEPLLNRDDNDVEIAYVYDAIRRVVRETVSPNNPEYRASRTYEYGLVSASGGWAWQIRVDVKGVAIYSVMDGWGRVLFEDRHDADAKPTASLPERKRTKFTYDACHGADAKKTPRHQVFREQSEFIYDELGQLTKAVQYDWMGDQQLELVTCFEYDDWGRQTCEIGPDGVRRWEVYDPIGSNPGGTGPAGNLPTLTSWAESADGKLRLGKTTTWFNLFEQPVQVSRFDLNEKFYSRHQYFYDGIGRTVREVDALNAVTRSAYDYFDRLVDQTLPGGAVVHRDYAKHSSEDLPTLISVNGVTLGEQEFDGLSRMIVSITGGRRSVMFYETSQLKPNRVRTAAGREINYTYMPQLGEDPRTRRMPGKDAKYDYDPENARLLHCEEGDQILDREYFSTGAVKQEVRKVGDEKWTMHYSTSLFGRQLSYIDVLGQEQSYEYYKTGQLKTTTLGSTSSIFEYDALGRTERYETRDGDQTLLTELEYDHQGRESVRRFTFSDGSVQVLEQEYSVLDQMSSRVLKVGDEVVRKEIYKYDLRGHLQEYYCTGLKAYTPQDPAGKYIREQFYDFDAIDNIVYLYTVFEDEQGAVGDNEATYYFEYDDPAQLSGVANTHPDYEDFSLVYDEDGNLVVDEKGKQLTYDAAGRMVGYDNHVYSFDALDRLASGPA